jgi:predicted RNA-binding Zn-ribbon protein involved in translation (DUF1610 family)
LALRGVTRSGAAYCLDCGSQADRDATECASCGAVLTDEAVAFQCPRCRRAMKIGAEQCPQCGQKFKLKSVKAPSPPAEAEDERLLKKLIVMERKVPRAPPVEDEEASEPAPPREPAPPVQHSPKFERLQMLRNMEQRLEEEKTRLAQISEIKDEANASTQAEAQIMSMADEMADMTMLQAHMEALADEIADLMTTPDLGLSETARERGLAAKALRTRLEHREKELEELRAREKQLESREEMVDRKIKAYAQKKKELDAVESDLAKRLKEVEGERAQLEKLRVEASNASDQAAAEAVNSRWAEERVRLGKRIAGLRSVVAGSKDAGAAAEISAAEEDLDRLISDLESRLRSIVEQKEAVEGKMSTASAVDEDLRRLLKVLDQMLGQLPAEVIERFSKSSDFELYEKVLDKFNV